MPTHVCAGSGLADKHLLGEVKHALLSIGAFLLCRVNAFLKASIVAIKETLESAPTAGDALFGHNLLEGQIRLFCNQSQDPCLAKHCFNHTLTQIHAIRRRHRSSCPGDSIPQTRLPQKRAPGHAIKSTDQTCMPYQELLG
jgi:hypothetical protein